MTLELLNNKKAKILGAEASLATTDKQASKRQKKAALSTTSSKKARYTPKSGPGSICAQQTARPSSSSMRTVTARNMHKNPKLRDAGVAGQSTPQNPMESNNSVIEQAANIEPEADFHTVLNYVEDNVDQECFFRAISLLENNRSNNNNGSENQSNNALNLASTQPTVSEPVTEYRDTNENLDKSTSFKETPSATETCEEYENNKDTEVNEKFNAAQSAPQNTVKQADIGATAEDEAAAVMSYFALFYRRLEPRFQRKFKLGLTKLANNIERDVEKNRVQ